jgi:5-methylcytosine-specific restriction enzyme A
MGVRRCIECPQLTHRPRCPACESRRNRERGSSTARGYGSAWQKLSALVIVRDGGLCTLQIPGVCTTYATTADHRIPKVLGGTDDLENLQGACRACNGSKGGRV